MSRTRLLILVSMLGLSSMAFARDREKPRYSVPEPTTIALAGAGIVGIGAAIWRKVRK